MVYVDTPAGRLIVQAEGNFAARPGDKASVSLDASRAHLFGEDGRAI